MIADIIVHHNEHVELVQSEITGCIDNNFASLKFKYIFNNSGKSIKNSMLLINNSIDLIVYSIKAFVDEKMIDFSIHEIDESKPTTVVTEIDNDLMDSMSSDALILNLGEIPENTKITIYLEASCVAKLCDPYTIEYKFPSWPLALNSDISADIDLKLRSSIKYLMFMGEYLDIKHDKIVLNGSFNENPSIQIQYTEPVSNYAISSRIEDTTYIGVSMLPDINPELKDKAEIYLVIDCSGSMSGNSIKVARETLTVFLKSLPCGTFFNIYRFGSKFESMFTESVECTAKNIERAINNVAYMNADLGLTDLFSPISDIMKRDVRKDCVRLIFVLTDGEISNEPEVLALAEKNRSTTRISCIGIGQSINKSFINDVSAYSGGISAFVHENDEIMTEVLKALNDSMRAAILDPSIYVEDTETISIAPFPIPPFFANSLSYFYISVNEDCESNNILVKGRLANEEVEIPVLIEKTNSINLDKFYGYFSIRDAENTIINAKVGDIPIIRQSLISKSSKYKLLSQFTSFWTEDEPKQQCLTTRQIRKRKYLEQKTTNTFSTASRQLKWGSKSMRISSTSVKEINLKYSMTNVISRQTFDGYWDDYVNLFNMLGQNIAVDFGDSKVNSTVIALALLENHEKHRKDAWKLIKDKAIAWLKLINEEKDWNQIIQGIVDQMRPTSA